MKLRATVLDYYDGDFIIESIQTKKLFINNIRMLNSLAKIDKNARVSMGINSGMRWIHPMAKGTAAYTVDSAGTKVYVDKRVEIQNTINRITKRFDDITDSGDIFILGKDLYNSKRRVYLRPDNTLTEADKYKLLDDPFIANELSKIVDKTTLNTIKPLFIDLAIATVGVPFIYDYAEEFTELTEDSDEVDEFHISRHQSTILKKNAVILNVIFDDCEEASKKKLMVDLSAKLLDQYYNDRFQPTVDISYTTTSGTTSTVTFIKL